MNIAAVKKHVIHAYNKNIPIMLWGPPGVGKSSIIHQVAKELNIELIDVRLAQIDPPDLRGIPVPDHEKQKTNNYYPDWLPEDGKGILFLDEIEKASTSVKNAALQLVLDRKIGSYSLPETWNIVAAGNREDDGCFSMPLGSALSNRMLHFEIKPDYNTWLEWAITKNIREDILGYLAFRPDHLYKQPDINTNTNAFPSPRSWEMLNTMLSGVDSIVEQNELIEAAVGSAIGKEYRVWYNIYRNVNVKDIFNGIIPEVIKTGKEQSTVYAITIAVAHYIKNNKFVEGSEANIAKFVSLLVPEMRTVFCRQIPASVLGKLIKHSAFRPIAEELMKIIF